MSLAIAPELDRPGVLAPEQPLNLEESGLSRDSVTSLIVKSLHGGEMSGMDLSDRIRLPYGTLEPLLEHLRIEMLVQVKSAAGLGTAGYRYTLTDAGRDRAHRYFEACGYVGPAPVPLRQYESYMAALRAQTREVYRERVSAAFTHLIVEPEMLDQLGPAISSGKAMFLYGAPGNGKSVMGEGIGRVLGGDIYVPHAIDIDGQVITMYDPVAHDSHDERDPGTIIRADTDIDGRWIRIGRPVITVGGELTLEMLDLRYKELSAFYEAPVHLKANGGVLVVDDFGRQRVPAPTLLIMDRTLGRESYMIWCGPSSGPLEYWSCSRPTSSRVRWNERSCAAFRTDPDKKHRVPVLEDWEMNCRRHGLEFNPAIVQHLHDNYYVGRKLEMRACHPRDLTDQVMNLCRYHRRPPELTTDILDAVCQSYFLEDTQNGKTEAR